ncbi:hypothetical protein [Paenibacillus solani]
MISIIRDTPYSGPAILVGLLGGYKEGFVIAAEKNAYKLQTEIPISA